MFLNIFVKLLELKTSTVLNILVLCIVFLMGVHFSHRNEFIFIGNLTLSCCNVRLL